MEVTNLKELKKLMKGDASTKFAFEEDPEVGSCYDKGAILFDYGNGNPSASKGGVATYNHTHMNSHKDRPEDGSDEGGAYERSRSSDSDSEIGNEDALYD
jgi:hypothetical protein